MNITRLSMALTARQLATLQGLTADQPQAQREARIGADGRAAVTLKRRSHDIELSLKKVAA